MANMVNATCNDVFVEVNMVPGDIGGKGLILDKPLKIM